MSILNIVKYALYKNGHFTLQIEIEVERICESAAELSYMALNNLWKS
jgi:hypothetical protein